MTWRDELLSLVESPAPAAAWLDDWITTLDRAIVAEYDEGRHGGPAVQALARCVVAVGPDLAEGASTVADTLDAAQTFVDDPTEAARQEYVARATRSYPYGPGDGCLALDGRACADPGSGCRSGAGTLAQVAAAIGADTVRTRIEAAVPPWLRSVSEAEGGR